MTKRKARTAVNVYLDSEQADRLKEIARTEDRALANLVGHILRLWLDDHDAARANG